MKLYSGPVSGYILDQSKGGSLGGFIILPELMLCIREHLWLYMAALFILFC